MNPLLIALAAPMLWAASNHIDKHMLAHELDHCDAGTLLLFSSLVGLIAAPIILVFHPDVLHILPGHAVLVIGNGVLYVAGLLPYFYALKEDDASAVVPLFQTTVVFSYALGAVVLGEIPNLLEIGASVLILVGSIALCIDFSGRARIRVKSLVLMLIASFLNALNFLLFKLVATTEDFWVTSFWEYIGFGLFGLVTWCCVGKFRRQFVQVLGKRSRVIGWSVLNEALGIGAKTATNLASMAVPIGMVSTISGLQPFFVLLFGVGLTALSPKSRGERPERSALAHKLSAISLMFVGTCIIAVQ